MSNRRKNCWFQFRRHVWQETSLFDMREGYVWKCVNCGHRSTAPGKHRV